MEFKFVDGKDIQRETVHHSHRIARYIDDICPVGKGLPRGQLFAFCEDNYLQDLREIVADQFYGKYEKNEIPLYAIRNTMEYKKLRRCWYAKTRRVIEILVRTKRYKYQYDERKQIIGVVRIK